MLCTLWLFPISRQQVHSLVYVMIISYVTSTSTTSCILYDYCLCHFNEYKVLYTLWLSSMSRQQAQSLIYFMITATPIPRPSTSTGKAYTLWFFNAWLSQCTSIERPWSSNAYLDMVQNDLKKLITHHLPIKMPTFSISWHSMIPMLYCVYVDTIVHYDHIWPV